MNAAPQPTPYIPYHRNPYFTGREDILHYLYTHLHITDNTKEVSSYALSGLGGIGKTQTIIEYAYRYAQEYSAVFWIGAESHESRIASLQRIAECLRLPEEQECHKMIAAVINWLNSHRNWLLLVDNIEDIDMVKAFLPSMRQGSLLLTTRLQTMGGLAHMIELGRLSLDEGVQLLQRYSRHLLPSLDAEQIPSAKLQAAQMLVEQMEGLPLAIEHAGALHRGNTL